MDAKLLIIDDEENVRSSLTDYFRREGFEVYAAEDGSEALHLLKQALVEVIILDVNLPHIDGLEICRIIRENFGQSVRIIMISGSKKDTIDRVVGLEMGADVYLLKPFETRELLAQVKALLRTRSGQSEPGKDSGWLVIDTRLRIHYARRVVEVDNKEAHLTRLEFEVLKYLADRPGTSVSRADLIDNVWDSEARWDTADAAVNTCIARLRSKIELDPAHPVYIQSVHGYGYRFKEP